MLAYISSPQALNLKLTPQTVNRVLRLGMHASLEIVYHERQHERWSKPRYAKLEPIHYGAPFPR